MSVKMRFRFCFIFRCILFLSANNKWLLFLTHFDDDTLLLLIHSLNYTFKRDTHPMNRRWNNLQLCLIYWRSQQINIQRYNIFDEITKLHEKGAKRPEYETWMSGVELQVYSKWSEPTTVLRRRVHLSCVRYSWWSDWSPTKNLKQVVKSSKFGHV